MVAVKEFSWEEVAAPDFENPARSAWRAAVAEIAAKATAALPACNGRVEKAAAMVLAGDVELLDDGKAKVASQSNGTTKYFVVNGTCECRDFAKAPSGWCKHRIAAGMAKRATPLAKTKLDAAPNGQATPVSQPEPLAQPQASPAVTSAPLPEAPASVNCHITLAGRQVQVTLRDQDETRLLGRLEALLSRYPVAEASSVVVPGSAPTAGVDWCPIHQTAMRWHDGQPNGWWSHKDGDGWCKGRPPKRGR